MLDIIDGQSLLVFTVVFLIVYLYWTTRVPYNFPPGPRRLPIIGNLNILAKNPLKRHEAIGDLIRKYGPVVGLKLGSYPTVILSGLDVIREAFVNQADVFSDRPWWWYVPSKVHNVNGKSHGILFNSGASWKNTRRFTLMSLRDFGVGKKSIEERIQEEGQIMCAELRKIQGFPVNIATICQKAISNIICSICFGTRFEYSDPEFNDSLRMLNFNISNPSDASPDNFIPLLRVLPISKATRNMLENNERLIAFIRKKIDQHRATFTPGAPRDFVDLYLENEIKGDNEDLTVTTDDIRVAIHNMFVAGTETTATSLCWLLLYMIHYPDIQSKCQEELDRIVGSGRRPSLSDRGNMPYIMATLQEIQRLGNIVPLALPHVARKPTTLWGYHIPKNTIVIPSLYSVNTDPDHWENPGEFRPDRWINKDGNLEKKEHFIPFSVGPRLCMGESLAKNELFLFFTSLLQIFTFKMADPRNPPSLEGFLGVTMNPAPYQMIIKEREFHDYEN